ncbi:DUF3037 domain-containing protein [Segetibacter sp. 3557_3]|uniref:DUF3037 domain-containing protein n=1 Tax=Segetibacter sp. 3557_3 TaxID=2547429 RepID=UPI0010590EA7|nr:DUF3037 domain-containing protein [Segetibacter sp. 3557_3]TDH21479.1 DUF3037 domain-containing protein [Segetibacter sp. 3557_3]
MQERHLFEYAVIRFMPRVEREEFLNVGIILFCASERFLQTRFHLDPSRLQCFCSDTNYNEVLQRLNAFEQICAGGAGSGPIGKFSQASRFRWLTAARSTIIQTSPVHPGMCKDAAATLARLYTQLVL